jgi:hypothetical protein
MLGKKTIVLVVMNTIIECEARRGLQGVKDIVEEEIPSFPSWIHGQARG